MGYHHLALAARDMTAIHHFYEEVMGFELVKVEVAPVQDGGWAKHFFYRMDGNDSHFIAFWELHDVPGTASLETNLSRAAGVPDYINHIAFAVSSDDELDRRKARWLAAGCDVMEIDHGWCQARWLAAGCDVMEIDHGWCHSVYTKDPNDNLVEFCLTIGVFTAADREAAVAALSATAPPFSKAPPRIEMHRAGTGTGPA
jgi:catechol 2,3-dioxygenase-like lactoylglutathione lyase family enzyme